MWATSSVLRWLWNWWVHAEQEAVLAHDQPGGESHEWYTRVFIMVMVVWMMGMVVWMLIIATIATTYILMNPGSWTELGLDEPVSLLLVVEVANVFAVSSTFVLLLSTRRVRLLWR